MSTELKTLALYANENGEEQLCVITHGLDRHPLNVDLKTCLPGFNEGSSLFLITLEEPAAGFEVELLDVADGYGQEVPRHFISLEY
jgi:hypothetical protein